MTGPTIPPSITNLPVGRTTFINRVQELALLDKLLRAGPHRPATARLITLTGPGGVGKTRLAWEAVSRARKVFDAGVSALDLTTHGDDQLLLAALASALGAPESTGRPLLMTVIGFLKGKRFLVWLDNCEYRIDECAALAESLLRACPDLMILATSREELKVPGERVVRLAPLNYLGVDEERGAELGPRLLAMDAVRLLVDRVRRVRPGFEVTEHNAEAVAQVCRSLDGLPLALELAAAQAATLTIEEIAARLADPLGWPAPVDTALPERHRTLQAVMDWSYSRLTPMEQVLLRRLAVFQGGFTLVQAERVCVGAVGEGAGAGGRGVALDSEDILDLIMSLTEKSLLGVDRASGAETRLRLLETVRQYAVARLVEAGEARTLDERHMAECLSLVEAAQRGMMGRDQARWQTHLTTELGNIRAALAWVMKEGPPEMALRLAGSMYLYWMRCGLLSEGRGWLREALARAEGAPTVAHAQALLSYGTLAWLQDDTTAAREALAQSEALWRETGQPIGRAYALAYLGMASLGLSSTDEARAHQQQWAAVGAGYGLAYALMHLGMVAFGLRGTTKALPLVQHSIALFEAAQHTRGLGVAYTFAGLVALLDFDLQRARQNYEQAVAYCRAAGDEWWLARALYNLGRVVMWQGDATQARTLHEESLALRRALDDRLGIAASIASLGDIARMEGDFPGARRYYEEALPLFRQLGPPLFIAWSLQNLGFTLLHAGQVEQSAALFRESLDLSQQTTFNPGVALGLIGLAGVALRRGQARRAAWLLGAADTMMATIGRRLQPVNYREYETFRAGAQARLPAAQFAADLANGADWSPYEALAYALSDDSVS